MARVFVTVGSTSFAALTAAVQDPSFLQDLQRRGYRSLDIQSGQDLSSPQSSSLCNRQYTVGCEGDGAGDERQGGAHPSGLKVDVFAYAPNLTEFMTSADLIISHAGAGTVLEALQLGKRLLVVPNETLMDNHQVELAHKLSRDGFCVSATPSCLIEGLRRSEMLRPRKWVRSDGSALNRIVKEELSMLTSS